MINSYIDFLKSNSDALINMSLDTFSISNYFKAIGSEFLFLGLIALILIVLAIVFIAPRFLITYIEVEIEAARKLNNKNMKMLENKYKYLSKVKETFRSYYDWDTTCAETYRYLKHLNALNELDLYEGGHEIFKALEEMKEIESVKLLSKDSKHNQMVEIWKKTGKRLAELNVCEELTSIEMQLYKYKKNTNKILKVVKVSLYVLWAILIIPFVMMLF